MYFLDVRMTKTKNVHDVQKDCLETTLCLLLCFIAFYMLVLDKIYVGGTKLVYLKIWVVNVRLKVPKDQPSFLEEGPFSRAMIALSNTKPRRQ